MSTAPDDVRHCTACGAAMTTATVAGVARRVCTSCRRIHYADPKVAVGVAVFRAGRLLLARRTMEPGRGRWSVPGGYVDLGEDPRVAAARETREETGVEVEVGEVIEVFAGAPGQSGVIFVLYAGRWLSGDPRPGDDCDAAAFFDRSQLPDLVFDSTELAVARWPQPQGEPG